MNDTQHTSTDDTASEWRETTAIPPVSWDEAESIALEEYRRMSGLLGSLGTSEWSADTPCEDWTVRDLAGHLVGAMRQYASRWESIRQQVRAQVRARRQGEELVDVWTEAQVEDLEGVAVPELLAEFADLVPRAVRTRMGTPRLLQGMSLDDGFGNAFSLGDLQRIVATRDCWLHRDDLRRAVGRDPVLDAHDARIVEDVVVDWAERHGQPFELVLTGPAGGRFRRGTGGESHELAALDFCRVLSGRGTGTGLLGHQVPF